MATFEKKSRVFVGSSSEARGYALAIQENLESPTTEVTVWQHDIFQLTRSSIDSLISAALEFDFAILVCSPDDSVISRDKARDAPRDNVIFEAGLFIGALGKERVFLIQPTNVDLKLPTDLAGVTLGQFYGDRQDGRFAAATAPISKRISDQIAALGPKIRPQKNGGFAAAICYRQTGDDVEYLLVRTSKRKWIFPKGIVLSDEPTHVAALRYAEDEGGVVGRIEIRDTNTFTHLKEDRGIEQRIVAHPISVHHSFVPAEEFRGPKWFSINEALNALTEGRSGKYAEELRQTLHWAKAQIENNSSTVRRLAGALPFRLLGDGTVEFMLITSRTTGNWVIPKGHILPAEGAVQAAAREALEEAGITGTIRGPAGNYAYRRGSLEYEVEVYGMRVEGEQGDWDDKGTRIRKWYSRSAAADLVNERGLKKIIETFAE